MILQSSTLEKLHNNSSLFDELHDFLVSQRLTPRAPDGWESARF